MSSIWMVGRKKDLFEHNIGGAVVKRRRDKGRWTKGRRRHKVDRAVSRHKANDKRPTGLVTMTKGRRHKADRASYYDKRPTT